MPIRKPPNPSETEGAPPGSASWFQRLLDTTPDVVVLYDATRDRILYVNEQITSVLGYEVDEIDIVGTRAAGALVHPEDQTRLRRFLEELSTRDEIAAIELNVKHRDGSWRCAHIHTAPFSNAANNRQFILVARDITELKRHEKALRASELRFRQAIEHAPVPMMLQAEDGEILVSSRALLESTGYAASALKDFGTWARLAYGPDADRITALIAAIFEQGPPPPVDLPVRMASGEVRQWSFHISDPHELADGRRAVVVAAYDLTDVLRSEQALTEAARQKDEFIAMLGHELRNPLAVMRAGIDLLGKLLPDEPQVRHTQEVLERQAAHMAYLLDGLLDVSRIARGKLTLQVEPVDVVEVVRQVVEDREDSRRARGLDLTLQLPEREVRVSGDRFRLAQVFDNLLSNAIKFTDPPGTVTVSVEPRGDEVDVTVRDTGPGLPDEVRAHVFEPLRQGSQDIARSSGGLGLGLALAKGLVELHQGRITYRHGDPGAVFSVALPLLAATKEDVTPPAAEAGEPEGLDLLLIEDNTDAADLLQMLLEMQGHDVRVAATGDRGLELARERVPDVIICDLGLPGISGYDVARAVRADEALAHVPLVALTGYGHDEARRQSSEAGFDEHLVKPVEVDALLQTLERLLAVST